jgi:hypothetical protein
LEQLEKYQAKARSEKSPNLNVFDEAHANMPLKEYIRKWSNWIIDFHWIFTLKYFIEFLPTNKLHFFIKNYPSLDNFILNWMWWSYSLNKDLECFTKDPFRAIGSMPWLSFDLNNSNKSSNIFEKDPRFILNNNFPHQNIKHFRVDSNLTTNKNNYYDNKYLLNEDEELEENIQINRLNKTQLENNNQEKKYTKKNIDILETNETNIDTFNHLKNLDKMSIPNVPKQPSKFFQYNEFTIKTICSLLFKNENNKKFYEKKAINKFINETRDIYDANNIMQLKRITRSNSCSNADDINIPMKILLELNHSSDVNESKFTEAKTNELNLKNQDISNNFYNCISLENNQSNLKVNKSL